MATYGGMRLRAGRRDWGDDRDGLALLEGLEPRLLLSGELLWGLSNPDATAQGDAYFGCAVAADGNLTVVGAYGASSYVTQNVQGVGRAYVFNSDTGALVATLASPSPAAQDGFGQSVAISGNLVVVGAPYKDIGSQDTGSQDAGMAYIFDATTGHLLRSLANPTPAYHAYFGQSVAISGNTVVVGAYGHGAAYLFDATTGLLLRTLHDATPGGSTRFGRAVGISGGTVVVSAPYPSANGSPCGTAYLFDASTGQVRHALEDPTPDDYGGFGDSVAIRGNTVVVGADYDSGENPEGFFGCGAAYIYDADSGNLCWTLPNPTPAEMDGFGYSVAVQGNTVVVGAFDDDASPDMQDTGSAYIYDAASGELLSTLSEPAPAGSDMFGCSVAVSGDAVVVGALGNILGGGAFVFSPVTGDLRASLGNNASMFGWALAASGNLAVMGTDTSAQGGVPGAAYVCDTSTGRVLWELSSPTPLPGDAFSASVAISGNTVAVAATGNSEGLGGGGWVYLFDATTGRLGRAINNPTRKSEDNFGASVAVSGNYVAVGAPCDDTVAEESGSVYIFDAVSGDLLRTLNSPARAITDQFGGVVAMSGNTLVVEAADAALNYSGVAYVFDVTSGDLLCTLSNPTPQGREGFGSSIAISGNTVFVGAPDDNAGADRSGTVYVYDATTGGLLRTLANPTPAQYDEFGWAVAASDGMVVVGTPSDTTAGPYCGAAYVFNAASGALLATLTTPTGGQAAFGFSVACSGGTVLGGAPEELVAGTTVGAAYAFAGNQAPAARPGGPYTVSRGAGLVLNGSASSDPNADWGDRISSYAWDLDGDGLYGDATGPTPTVPWAQLAGMTFNADLGVGLRVTDSFGVTSDAATTMRIVVPEVVGRYAFYNNSYWDGDAAGANAADDAAIAPDKQPLLPGGAATFANYTSYSRGINGIMIDVSDLPAGATPTAADFEFRVGNDNAPTNWPLASAAPAISVRRGAGVGGSDRITLTFPDGTAAGKWLGVKVLAGGAVALASDEVFYFGNAIGEVGNLAAPQDAKVTTLDVSLTRSNLIALPAPAPTITNVYDFNRDHKVNTMDVSLMRSYLTTAMNALKLITVPAEAALGAATKLMTENGFAKPQAAATGTTTPALALATRTMDALAATVGLSKAGATFRNALGRVLTP